MTKSEQVETLMAPLLARHPDLFLFDRTLGLRPVRHFARMVVFGDGTSPDVCVPKWIVLPTFRPNVGVASTLGRCFSDLYSRRREYGRWLWSDAAMMADVAERVEAYALPLLRPLDTFERSLWFGIGHTIVQKSVDHRERMVMDIAGGELDAARRIWSEAGHTPVAGAVPSDPSLQADDDAYGRIGPPLLADDRPALSRLLHGWEAANLRGSPLEPYWAPTPFPLDAGL